MKTLLITRPREEAAALAEALERMGFSAFIEPLLDIAILEPNKIFLKAALATRPQLLLATSKRAVEAFCAMSAVRKLPLLTVGHATAQYAEMQGFLPVSWRETANDLPAYVREHYAPSAGGLLYIRGADIRVDIASELAAHSFDMQSVTLYRAVAREQLSEALCAHMERGAIDGALFFSQRTASIYVDLAQKHGLAEAHRAMRALCMSAAVAEELNALPWQSVTHADKPDTEHMLAALSHCF